MMKIITWLTTFWPKLPMEVRKPIGWAIGLAVLILPAMVVYYTLRDGSLQNKLGLEVPTKADLTNAADAITTEVTLSQNMGLLALKDSLAEVDSTMRADYLVPGVKILNDLVDEVERIKEKQGEAQHSLSRINTNSNEQLRQLQVIAADDTRTEQERILLRMEQQFQALRDSLLDREKEVKPLGKRTSRVKM